MTCGHFANEMDKSRDNSRKMTRHCVACYFSEAFLWITAVILGLLAVAGPAAAHAELLAADPSPGAVLAASPAEVRLTFSEAMQAGSTFVIFGEGFAQVPGISPAIEAQAPEQLGASIPTLAPGAYTVQWKAVTGDGHEVSGSYSFRVETGAKSFAGGGPGWAVGAVMIVIASLLAVLLLSRGRRRH